MPSFSIGVSIIFRKKHTNNQNKIYTNLSNNNNQDAETEELNLYKYFSRHSKSQNNNHNKVYSSIPTTNICIVNLSTRAGSTFVSLNLAKSISLRNISVAVIEAPIEKPFIYDHIGLEEKVKDHPRGEHYFYSYLSEINRNKPIDTSKNILYDDIYWIVGNPKDRRITEWDETKMRKLIHAKKNIAIKIFDFGSNYFKPYIEKTLDDMDYILIVVDPMPAEVMQNDINIERFKELQSHYNNIFFIINKWTTGIDEVQLLRFMEIDPLERIPYISPQIIHKSIYQCKIPYESKDIQKKFNDSLERIADKMLHIRK